MILGINVTWDREQLARLFVDVYKVPYLAGRDGTGTIGELYGIEATPTSLFVDKAGRLVDLEVGELGEADFTKRIESLLK